ncbi:hypothetical protein OIV83_005849 [Microbotryomycetes sp. JL201]|nr:hypothetical protein OIV83_005849 [Microbotryomycetes sp. JL201]
MTSNHISEPASDIFVDPSSVKATSEDRRHPLQPSSSNYFRWDAPGVEVIPEDEKDKIRASAEIGATERFQQMNFNEHHHMFRGTHLKTQGCVKGKLVIDDNLPDYLRQGMFKNGGVHDVILRYSSLTPKLLPDTVPAPRGVGIKVFGVKGEKIWKLNGEDKETQDFTFNNYPLLELRDPKTTNEIADSLERNWDNGDKFVEELKTRKDADVACYAGGLKQQHMAAMPQYSQSAYRYGEFVAKFALFPATEEQRALANWSIEPTHPPNVLATTLQDLHKRSVVKYSFNVQLLQNLNEQPVDDIGVVWDEQKYPWQQVAMLEFEPQDSFLPSFRNWWDDQITCNGWHGLKEHQPLGSTNRMRRVVYAESRMLRMKTNDRQCIEPGSIAEVPA